MTESGYASPNSIMAFYRNTTGATVTSITIKFLVERYRVNTSTFSLAFFSSTDGTTWTSRPTGDIGTGIFATGASAYTFGTPQTFYKTVTITGLSIANNGDFYLRWVFTNSGSTNSQGLGLDNVVLFAGTATPALKAALRDSVSIDLGVPNQANPGDQLTYTTVIKDTGTADATNVILTQPIPTNTTLVNGYRTSSLARDDGYTTGAGSTLAVLPGSGVLVNDFGIPAPTVLSFGPVSNSSATAAGGSGNSDNGGSVSVSADGSFVYTPPVGFNGIDKFSYKAGNGNAPDNDGIVTITVGAAPVANPETYNVVGNVSIIHNAAQGVLANDAGSGITVTAVNGSAANVGAAILTTNNGNLTVNANGSFTYNPPVGFEGSDNFTYTIDNGFSSPSTATVTLTVAGMVWFITNGGAAGDGRLSTPFNSIGAFQAVNNGAGSNPAANDNIFVFENASAYTGSLTLLNSQRSIGQDATASLSVITGLTPNATYSTQFPAMNIGAPVTTLTTTVAATNAVNLNSAAGSNLLRGFTLGNTTGSGINGSGFGTLTISDVSKNGTGQALALTNGAFGATATIDNITTTSSVNAISLSTITGSLTITNGAISGATGTAFTISGGTVSVTYGGNITQANNAALVSIIGGHATGTITFNTGTLSATNGNGLQFDNADATYNFFGTTTLNGGDAGIDILNGSGGAFAFATTSGSIALTSPTGTAFNVAGPTGTIDYDGNITQANNAYMISITGGHTGTITFVTGNTLSASNGNGLQFDNAGGAYNFNGTTTLNGAGDEGIDILNGSGGTFNFGTGTSITSPSGISFNISGTASTCNVTYSGSITHATATAMVNITGGHNAGTITFQTGTLNATAGTGLQFDNADGTYNFNGTTTLNGGDAGIDILNGSGGTFSFTSGSAITNPTGIAININNSPAGNITYSGTFNKTNAGIGIQINNKTGGTVAFNGTSTKTLSTSTSNAINLTSNTGGTINFSGNNLLLTTTTGIGFNATGGGTISVTGTGNTINASSGGTALNVVNTSIASTGLNFVSVASPGGSATGIILDNTGTAAGNGGLTVNGDGTNTAVGGNSTGGIISGKSGADGSTTTGIDVYLNNTKNVVLRRMTINGTNQNFGIRGSSVTGFILEYCTIGGTNGTNVGVNEGSVIFTELTGAATITNCNISGAVEDNVSVVNTSGILNRITVTDTTFGSMNTSTGNDGMLIESMNTAVINATIQNNLFTFAIGDHFQYSNNTVAQSGDIVFTGNTISNTGVTAVGGGGGIRFIGGSNVGGLNGSMTFNVSGNTLRDSRGTALAVNKLGGTGNFSGTIANNTIGDAGVNGSGSSEGSCIFVLCDGPSPTSYTASITGNTVRQYANFGIFMQTGGSGVIGSMSMHVNVTGNTVSNPSTFVFIKNGIHLNGGVSPGDTYFICLNMGGAGALANSITGTGTDGGTDFRLRQRQSTTVRLPGYAGANNDNAAVVSFIQGRNGGTPTGSATNTVPTGGGFVGGVPCNTP